MDVTSLHLSGNNLTQLSQNMFLGRSRLKEILVKQSNVFEIENGKKITFKRNFYIMLLA